MPDIKIKICGLRRTEDIGYVNVLRILYNSTVYILCHHTGRLVYKYPNPLNPAVNLFCKLFCLFSFYTAGEVAHGLGLSALVEAHSREEVERALKAGARIVGVNNRDLRTFKVDKIFYYNTFRW